MNKSGLIEKLEKLANFQTVTGDHEANSMALSWIEQELHKHGLETKRYHCEDFPSLICSTKNSKKPKLILGGHLDVVPGDLSLFDAQVVDDKMFGRGVYDMKFSIACYLQLLEDLGEKIKDYDLSIMITTDEETGGHNGVKYLIEQGLSAEAVFLPDGGYNWSLDVASRGVWRIEFESEGVSAHGSRPWEGSNALVKLMLALQELHDSFDNLPTSDVSFAITSLSSGEAQNQIPDYARATVDIRFSSQEVFDRTEALIKDVVNRHHDVGYITIWNDSFFRMPGDNKYLKSYSKLVQKHAGQIPTLNESYGSSDARFFADIKVPVIISAPIGGDAHGENEWIDLNSLETYYDILKEFVELHGK